MNVLSLFDGMGCGWIALKGLGIEIDHAYSSEIDKFAISQVRYNFPDVVHLGSVTDVDVSRLEPIDLLYRYEPNMRDENEKAGCFLSTSWKGAQANGMTLINKGYRVRRLTPTECARLQTIPDWYEWKGRFPNGSIKDTSDTQIYKMCGNGWCVEVIKHILSFMKNGG